MGRRNSVTTHPKRLDIERAIRNGESLTSISARFGSVSVSSLSRYAISQKAALVRLIDADEGPTELAARFRELADSARKLRQLADMGGNTSERARAIQAEREVLIAISDRLGIDDLSVVEFMTDTKELVSVLRSFASESPDAAEHLLLRMSKHAGLTELALHLRRAG
jgi:hypothetical protein